MIINPREQWEYYVVPFPFIYKCVNGRLEIRIVGASYCSQLQACVNNQVRIGGAPDVFYRNAIFVAICLEPRFSNGQQALMYLIDLEREGMRVEDNKFVFPHQIIFEDYEEAYLFSKNIQIPYSAAYVLHSIDMLAEIRRQKTSQEIFHIASDILGETLTDAAKDMLKETITDFSRTGVLSFDIFTPPKITFVLLKSFITVLVKQLNKC